MSSEAMESMNLLQMNNAYDHTLASGSVDKTIKLWEADGTLLQTLANGPAPTNDVYSVAWSPNGTTLASGSGDQGTIGYIKLWKADGNKKTRSSSL